LVDHPHQAAGVNVCDAFAQRIALVLARGAAHRLHLAVDVGLGYVVHVDQHQLGHAAACQGFHGPGPHAAQADDTDAG
jgi:hypothetical protein